MIVYFFTAIFSSLFLYLFRVTKQKNKLLSKSFIFLSFVIIWIVSAIRYGVGTDYFSYYNYVNYVDKLQFSDIKNREYGFWILGKIVALFSDNGQLLIFVTSFIILFFIYKVICEYSSYPEISILIFFGLGFYFNSLNIIRQYIALSIVFFSVHQLHKKNIKKYVTLVLIATLFHYTALLGFVFLFVSIKKSRLYRTFVILLILISVALFDKVLSYITPEEYYMYLSSSFVQKGANYIFFLISLLISLLLIILYKPLKNRRIYNEFYILCSIIGTSASLIGTKSLIIMRIAEYFTIFSLISLPEIIKITTDKNIRVVIYLCFVFISIIGIYLFLSKNLGGVLPYNIYN
ncbi:EpsG family protein [Rossellomorea marisflavi]|uniref:EpsG family protein n=1 Tax=Rossellomorea marisflavi TaxID=189381 RepID=A0A163IX33_9BACI|nr:EpsG family protein [Rossellomorea marisflavi]KZE43901.1 hypothetical protein AV649_08645 [Rossellomorea marisflavi]